MDNLQNFPFVLPFGIRINYGVHGEIYALSRRHIAKVYRDPAKLEREREVSGILYSEGISVPKPEGVFRVRINPFRTTEAFVMEYVHGIIGEKIADKRRYKSIRPRVEQLMRSEVEKCEDLGFICQDADRLDNSIYKPKEDSIVLVDFCNWEMPN